MISEGYRTHRGVTGPMDFKKSGFFFGKSFSRKFGAPGCHPGFLINLVKTGLDSRDSAEPKSKILEGYVTHRGVTGPLNFKKQDVFSENRAPGVLGPLATIQPF